MVCSGVFDNIHSALRILSESNDLTDLPSEVFKLWTSPMYEYAFFSCVIRHLVWFILYEPAPVGVGGSSGLARSSMPFAPDARTLHAWYFTYKKQCCDNKYRMVMQSLILNVSIMPRTYPIVWQGVKFRGSDRTSKSPLL